MAVKWRGARKIALQVRRLEAGGVPPYMAVYGCVGTAIQQAVHDKESACGKISTFKQFIKREQFYQYISTVSMKYQIQ